MKKFFKYALYLAFALVLHQEIWGNLTFGPEKIFTIIKAAIILAFFELILKPIVKILLLPISIITLGLIRIVINTLGLYLVTFLLPVITVGSFSIYSWNLSGFFAYLGTSFFISLFLQIFKIL